MISKTIKLLQCNKEYLYNFGQKIRPLLPLPNRLVSSLVKLLLKSTEFAENTAGRRTLTVHTLQTLSPAGATVSATAETQAFSDGAARSRPETALLGSTLRWSRGRENRSVRSPTVPGTLLPAAPSADPPAGPGAEPDGAESRGAKATAGLWVLASSTLAERTGRVSCTQVGALRPRGGRGCPPDSRSRAPGTT